RPRAAARRARETVPRPDRRMGTGLGGVHPVPRLRPGPAPGHLHHQRDRVDQLPAAQTDQDTRTLPDRRRRDQAALPRHPPDRRAPHRRRRPDPARQATRHRHPRLEPRPQPPRDRLPRPPPDLSQHLQTVTNPRNPDRQRHTHPYTLNLTAPVLIRRSLTDLSDLAFYLCAGPAEIQLSELVRIAGARWAIEECFQAAKTHTGL